AEDAAALFASMEIEDPLELPGTGPVAVGAIPFLDGRAGELVIPARIVGRTEDGRIWMTEVGRAPTAPAAPAVAPAPEPTSFVVESEGGRLAWTAAVRRALDAISRGTVEKVVLARRVAVWGDQPFAIPVVVNRLRRAHPSCF